MEMTKVQYMRLGNWQVKIRP